MTRPVPDQIEEKPPRTPAAAVAVFLLAIAGLAVLSYFNFRTFRQSARQENGKDLMSIAEIKAGAIRDWRHERIVDGTILFRNPYIYQSIRDSIGKPSGEAWEEMKRFLTSLQAALDYKRILLRDIRLAPVFSVPDAPPALRPERKRESEEALRTARIVLSDIYRDDASGDLLMDLIVPVLGPATAGSSAAGVFVFQIDPRRYLFPAIQSWPSSSRTGETLIVRREGDEVVFLNDLRHKKDTALRLRLPFGEGPLPAAMAARGSEGLVQGLDYRGVEVLAALRKIPDSPWFLIAKIDSGEIFAAVRRRGWITALFVSILILTAALGFWMIRRDQRLKFYRRRYEAERALRESERKFRTLFESSGDAILIHDYEGRILDVNRILCDRLGYSRDEILSMNSSAFEAPEFSGLFNERIGEVVEKTRIFFESAQIGKNGSRIPVHISWRAIDYEGRPAVISTTRNITEQKRVENALKKTLAEKEILLREINHRVKNNMAIVSSLLSLQAGRVSDPGAKAALLDSRERVRTMGLIHEKLYRSADFAHIDFSEYLRDVAARVIQSYQGDSKRIGLETRIEAVPVELDWAIPCGLIVNELVSNAMKHAFPEGRAGIIRIEFGPAEGGGFSLAVSNDGIPLPADYDLRTSASFGMQIVAILAEQLGGTLGIMGERGVGFKIAFNAAERQRTQNHA